MAFIGQRRGWHSVLRGMCPSLFVRSSAMATVNCRRFTRVHLSGCQTTQWDHSQYVMSFSMFQVADYLNCSCVYRILICTSWQRCIPVTCWPRGQVQAECNHMTTCQHSSVLDTVYWFIATYLYLQADGKREIHWNIHWSHATRWRILYFHLTSQPLIFVVLENPWIVKLNGQWIFLELQYWVQY